jgi:hypothetical protein
MREYNTFLNSQRAYRGMLSRRKVQTDATEDAMKPNVISHRFSCVIASALCALLSVVIPAHGRSWRKGLGCHQHEKRLEGHLPFRDEMIQKRLG